MILRIYRAVTLDGRQPSFRRFLEEIAVPRLRSQDGLEQLIIGWPRQDTPCEFSMIQIWRDLGALEAFAGARWREPVMHPMEERLLEKAFVDHYEVD